jgi:hypothetical protein
MGPPKAAISLVCARSGVAGWSLHDLRRTVRTRLPGLGVTPDVAERVLGHTIGGIRRVYDHHDYVPQKMAALEAWSAELERMLHQPVAPVNADTAPAAERPPRGRRSHPGCEKGAGRCDGRHDPQSEVAGSSSARSTKLRPPRGP